MKKGKCSRCGAEIAQIGWPFSADGPDSADNSQGDAPPLEFEYKWLANNFGGDDVVMGQEVRLVLGGWSFAPDKSKLVDNPPSFVRLGQLWERGGHIPISMLSECAGKSNPHGEHEWMGYWWRLYGTQKETCDTCRHYDEAGYHGVPGCTLTKTLNPECGMRGCHWTVFLWVRCDKCGIEITDSQWPFMLCHYCLSEEDGAPVLRREGVW